MYNSFLLILQYKLSVARETVMAAMVLLMACGSNELSAELNQTVLGGIASAGKTAVLVLMLYTCSNANEENICRIMHVISLMVFGSNDQVGEFSHSRTVCSRMPSLKLLRFIGTPYIAKVSKCSIKCSQYVCYDCSIGLKPSHFTQMFYDLMRLF